MTVDYTCPSATNGLGVPVPTRLATTFYTTPPPLSAQGYARIHSIIVGSDDIYFAAADDDGPMIRTVKTDGTGESVAFQDPSFAPFSRLAGYGQTLFWFDQSGDPGRVVEWQIGSPTPSVAFDAVLMGDLGEIEQYFDASNNHFILANVRDQAGTWRSEILRKNANDGSIDVLHARSTMLGGAQQLAYALFGDTFYVAGPSTDGGDLVGVLPIASGGPPIDPATPPDVVPVLEAPCAVLVALGETNLWCLGGFETVGQIPDVKEQQVLRAMRRDPATGDRTWYTLFDTYQQPDEPGRGAFSTEAATNGSDLYFVTSEVVDGTGGVVSTLYKATDTGSGFEVSTVLCNLPEITDMTLTGGSLYYATFINDLDRLDEHGLWRLDL
ncbi:MAG: hypothetical protein JNL21_29375 [Myxococcales bacterium]|nr:hypothetical protein [Myxococcales bacterium]